MMTLTITIHVVPTKQRELVQTLHELQPLILQEKGCEGFAIAPETSHVNTIIVSEEWATRSDVLTHVHSEHFHVLRGAIKVLACWAEMSLCTEGRSLCLDVKQPPQFQDIHKRVAQFFSSDESESNERGLLAC